MRWNTESSVTVIHTIMILSHFSVNTSWSYWNQKSNSRCTCINQDQNLSTASIIFQLGVNLPLTTCNPPKLRKIKTKAKVHTNIQVKGKVSLWWGPVLSLWAVSVTASRRLQVWLWDSDNTWVSIGFEPGFSTVLIVILIILLVLIFLK